MQHLINLLSITIIFAIIIISGGIKWPYTERRLVLPVIEPSDRKCFSAIIPIWLLQIQTVQSTNWNQNFYPIHGSINGKDQMRLSERAQPNNGSTKFEIDSINFT